MLAYLIRHGESRFNVDSSGGLNSPLTERGLAQARAVADRLRAAPLKAIYCSPFERCLQSAQAIIQGRGNLVVRIRPELFEYHHVSRGQAVDTGLCTLDEIRSQFPLAAPCPDAAEPMTWPAADETIAEVASRVRSFAEYLNARCTGPDDAVAVVSHGSPIARLVEAWLTDSPGPSFRFLIENAGVTALRHEPAADGAARGVSSLVCLNDISHLLAPPGSGGAAPSEPLLSTTGSNFNPDGTVKLRRASSYW